MNGRKPRSRSNTAHAYGERHQEPEPEPVRPSIRSDGRVASGSRLETQGDYPESPVSPARPNWSRSRTIEGPTSNYRETTPVNGPKTSFPNEIAQLRGQLRPANRTNTAHSDLFGDPSDASTASSASPDRSWRDRSISPTTSHSSTTSVTGCNGGAVGKKGPPPPPPSRAKKPPPPPPMKRADFSATSVHLLLHEFD